MRALLVLVTHNVHELVVCTDPAKTENVTKLTAVCQRCLRDASFTQRLSNETKVEVGAISAMVTEPETPRLSSSLDVNCFR